MTKLVVCACHRQTDLSHSNTRYNMKLSNAAVPATTNRSKFYKMSSIRALQTDDLNMAERLLTLSKIEADTFSDRSYLSPSIFRSTTSDRLAACVGLVRIQDDCMIGLATVSVISPP